MQKLALIIVFLTTAFTAQAQDIRIVVDRSGEDVELYFNFSATKMSELFGRIPETVLDDAGYVDFRNLQFDTVTPGDDMIAQTTAYSDDGVIFEAMSFMVHPSDTDLAFDTPWDAILTTTFCSVDPNAPPQVLDIMETYASYFADGVAPNEPLVIDLPWTGTTPLTVEVREFENKDFQRVYTQTLAADGKITMFADDGGPAGWISTALNWLRNN
ncbi:MAG: hypothetical protein AAF826_08310 [Pseudomonadota bacterium]